MTNTLNLFIKITPSQLPENARRFIAANYSKAKIVYIDKIKEDYEVKLSNGTYINFDNRGNWNYISSDDCISENALPKNIANRVKSIIKKYKDNKVFIFEINKKINCYKVRLSNSLDLCIAHNGELLA